MVRAIAALALALSACTAQPRHEGGFFLGINRWGQGANPGSDCPHQYPYYVVAPDGHQFFLECFGKR
jgi:hypothetical protein